MLIWLVIASVSVFLVGGSEGLLLVSIKAWFLPTQQTLAAPANGFVQCIAKT